MALRATHSTKLIKRAGMVAGGVAAILALTAAPASADGTARSDHGSDLVEVVNWRQDADLRGWSVEVWDKECDGNHVYAQFVLYNSSVVRRVDDPDGCHGQSGRYVGNDTRVSSFRICEAGKGCENWRQGP